MHDTDPATLAAMREARAFAARWMDALHADETDAEFAERRAERMGEGVAWRPTR